MARIRKSLAAFPTVRQRARTYRKLWPRSLHRPHSTRSWRSCLTSSLLTTPLCGVRGRFGQVFFPELKRRPQLRSRGFRSGISPWLLWLWYASASPSSRSTAANSAGTQSGKGQIQKRSDSHLGTVGRAGSLASPRTTSSSRHSTGGAALQRPRRSRQSRAPRPPRAGVRGSSRSKVPGIFSIKSLGFAPRFSRGNSPNFQDFAGDFGDFGGARCLKILVGSRIELRLGGELHQGDLCSGRNLQRGLLTSWL
mmetsp:Transcript_35327/g.75283  ORF Transcript_35327/g.75283 Transcript_35327/m.75283 type:complete len:252 (+) Transcript_35327:1660-2415(+)